MEILYHWRYIFNLQKSQINREKKFIAIVLDLEYNIFKVYVAAFSIDLNNKIHLSIKVQIVYLKADKDPTKFPSKYTNFVDIFLIKLTTEFFKYININNYIIE